VGVKVVGKMTGNLFCIAEGRVKKNIFLGSQASNILHTIKRRKAE
jgi:hypothetical protein